MITPFSTTPKPQNKLAKYVMAACFGSFLILIMLSMMMLNYKGLISVAALVFVTAGIFIYNKYIYTVYSYEVVFDMNGVPLFVVRHTQKKHMATLCRVEISNISDVKKLNREERKAYKVDRSVPSFSYCPTMCPDTVYLVTVRSFDENADIFVELTDESAALLLRYSKEARGYDS